MTVWCVRFFAAAMLFSSRLNDQVVEASKNAPGSSAVFVPYPYLGPVGAVLKGSSVGLGAQV
jgi:hypothetical protein